MKKQNKPKIQYSRSDVIAGYAFCSVWIVGFLVFTLYPIIQTLIFSFYGTVNVQPGHIETSGAGFQNYVYALTQDAKFQQNLSDYAIKLVLYVPVITVVWLVLAMLLNNKLKGTGFFRTIFFLPVIITSGPVLHIFIEQGVASFPGIDNLINFASLESTVPKFILDALKFLTDEFIMILWFSGIQILVFMTGLQKMDKNMYEAAQIDGASKWEMFWKLTLPALNPTIVLNVVFTVVMQSVFSLNPIIQSITTYMNNTGEGGGYGYASATSWIYFVVMLALLGLSILVFKKHERRVKR